MKMILRRWITDFSASEDREKAPVVPDTKFKRDCFALAGEIGGRIHAFEPRGITPNFHRACFEHQGKEIWILCNAIYPIIGFPVLFNSAPPLMFRDVGMIADRFRSWGYEVPGSMELNAEWKSRDLDALDPAERTQIRYWKPRSIGDIVFNWYD
jgi:hypothetical protein